MNNKIIIGIVLVVIAIGGYFLFRGNDLERAYRKMNKMDNYTMTITISGERLRGGSYIRIDGNKAYYDVNNESFFTVEEDGILYQLENRYGDYVAIPIELESDVEVEELAQLDLSEFREDYGGYFRSLQASDSYSDYVFRVEDGYITLITFKGKVNGYDANITMEFSKIGTTTIMFPNYRFDGRMDDIIKRYTSMGFQYSSTGNGYTFELVGTKEISMDLETGLYELEYNDSIIIFDPNSEKLHFDGETKEYRIGEYLALTIDPVQSATEFELLMEFYELYKENN